MRMGVWNDIMSICSFWYGLFEGLGSMAMCPSPSAHYKQIKNENGVGLGAYFSNKEIWPLLVSFQIVFREHHYYYHHKAWAFLVCWYLSKENLTKIQHIHDPHTLLGIFWHVSSRRMFDLAHFVTLNAWMNVWITSQVCMLASIWAFHHAWLFCKNK